MQGCICRPVGLADTSLGLFRRTAGEGVDQERPGDPGVLLEEGKARHGIDRGDREVDDTVPYPPGPGVCAPRRGF